MEQSDILLDHVQNNNKMYGIITNTLIPILVSNDDDDDTDSNIDFFFQETQKTRKKSYNVVFNTTNEQKRIGERERLT